MLVQVALKTIDQRKCLQLKRELEVEPIFVSIAAYDAKERKMISKNILLRHELGIATLVVGRTRTVCGRYSKNIKDSIKPNMKDDKNKYRDKAKFIEQLWPVQASTRCCWPGLVSI